MFVYKHTETIDTSKSSVFFRKTQTLPADNLRIVKIKNVKFLGCYCYITKDIGGFSNPH